MKIWHKFIHTITRHFRQKRGKLLREKFPNIVSWHICDLGGSRHFWEKLAIDGLPLSNIIIFNISEGETQSTLSGHGNFDEIKVIIYDGKTIPVADAEFDLLVCNSVLEHVLPDQREKLVAEMKRVAKHIFIQTPAYSFPIEPHFIMPLVHWLPKRVGYWLIHLSPWRILSQPTPQTIADYWWNTQLLSWKEIKALFPSDSIQYETVLGLTKSYYVIS